MKILRKYLFSFVLFLLVAVCPILMVACDKKEPDGLSIYQDFKTEYYWGQDLDVSGGIIKCVNDGKTTYVALNEDMVSAFHTNTEGTREMIITHEDLTLRVEYSVSYYRTISLLNTFNTTYVVDDEIDLTGGQIKCLEQDPTYVPAAGEEISNPLGLVLKESTIDITNDMISNFSTETKGRKTMTLTYKGCSLDIDYSVVIGRIQTDKYYMSDTQNTPETVYWNDGAILMSFLSRYNKMCCAATRLESIDLNNYSPFAGNDPHLEMEEHIDQDGNMKYYLTGNLSDSGQEVSMVIEMTGKNTFKISQRFELYMNVQENEQYIFVNTEATDTYTLYIPE